MNAVELTATVAAGLVGTLVVLMGAWAVSAPAAFAGFGIPGTRDDDPTALAWIRVKGVRDVSLGLVLALALVAGGPTLLGCFLLAATVVPAGDAAIVLRSGGPRSAGLGVHGLTAAVMAVTAGVLLVA